MASVTTKTFTEADGAEREFAFGKMNAVDAVKVYYPLIKILPPLFKALGGLAAKQEAAKTEASGPAAVMNPGAVIDALAAANEDDQLGIIVDGITSRLSSDELIAMMKTVFKSVRVRRPGDEGGQVVDMDVHFTSGLSRTMLLVFVEALKVNFSDFSAAVRSGSRPAGAPTA
jgi:hypothetical protein